MLLILVSPCLILAIPIYLIPFILITGLGLWIHGRRLRLERNAKLDKDIAQVEEKIRGLLAET